MVTIFNQEQDAKILEYFAARGAKGAASGELVQTYSDGTDLGRARIYERLRAMVRRGALVRIKKGRYRIAAVRGGAGTGSTRYEAMWRIMRARRVATLDDMQELCGVSRDYACQFYAALVRNEAARRLGHGKYQLIKDTVTMPRNEAPAARQRAARKKAALAALANIQASLDEARSAVAAMEE